MNCMQDTRVKEQGERLMNVHLYEIIYAAVKIKITFLYCVLDVHRAAAFRLFNVDKKITRTARNLFCITKNTLNRSKCAFN